MRFLSGAVVLATKMLIPAFGALYADAADGWTAVCSEPHGTGYEYGDLDALDGTEMQSPGDGFQRMEDSFRNVNPIFMYPGGAAKTVSVVWGDTKPENMSPELFDKPKAEQATVIYSSRKRVTTIKAYLDEAWMTTHFPEAGIAYATRHERWRGFGDTGYLASALTFPMECDYRPLR